MLQLTFLQEYSAKTFHSGLNQKLSTCKRLLLGKIGRFVSCVTIPRVRKFLKTSSFLIYLLIQIDFFSNYRFESITQNLNWKLYSCRGWFNWKTLKNDPCIEIMLLQIFLKIVIKKIYVEYRNGVFPHFLFWFLSGRSQLATSHLEKMIPFKFRSAGFLHQNLPIPNDGKFFLLTFVDIQPHISL